MSGTSCCARAKGRRFESAAGFQANLVGKKHDSSREPPQCADAEFANRSAMAHMPPAGQSVDCRMLIPSAAEELERAAGEEPLNEKARFEVKRELPASKKNADMAVDVSALTVDDGLLIYGVDENEHGRPTVASSTQRSLLPTPESPLPLLTQPLRAGFTATRSKYLRPLSAAFILPILSRCLGRRWSSPAFTPRRRARATSDARHVVGRMTSSSRCPRTSSIAESSKEKML